MVTKHRLGESQNRPFWVKGKMNPLTGKARYFTFGKFFLVYSLRSWFKPSFLFVLWELQSYIYSIFFACHIYYILLDYFYLSGLDLLLVLVFFLISFTIFCWIYSPLAILKFHCHYWDDYFCLNSAPKSGQFLFHILLHFVHLFWVEFLFKGIFHIWKCLFKM